MVKLETDEKFKRPGIVLLLTGIGLFIARIFVGWIPLIGGLLAFICTIAGIALVLGGIFLLVTKRNAH